LRLVRFFCRNFRNLRAVDIAPGDKVNVLVGPNAAGKTNVLEAISLLATGASRRASSDAEMVRWERDAFVVGGDVAREPAPVSVRLTYHCAHAKRATVNGKPVRRLSDLMRALAVVAFVPDDLALVKAGPAARRRFLDTCLCQASPTYYQAWREYYRCLQQRNALLKRANRTGGARSMAAWDERLARAGADVSSKRARALLDIGPIAAESHAALTGGAETLHLTYEPSPPCTGEPSRVEEALLAALRQRRDEELARGVTLSGPHRDDFVTAVNGRDLRAYGSQGQQRTAALALKLAELHFVTHCLGERPVLLLDDVASELDSGRRRALTLLLRSGAQSFITCTDRSSLDEELHEASVVRVSQGEVRPDE